MPAILEMARQTGPAVFDGDGYFAERDGFVRHLLLPSNTRNTAEVLSWLASNLPQGVLVSLMAQYIPCGRAAEFPEINRRVTKREYDKVQDSSVFPESGRICTGTLVCEKELYP